MRYDWREQILAEPFTSEWFDAMDTRFTAAIEAFATETVPFDRLIPYERIRGARVLEIGCGMGLHTELMCRAGAEVAALDLTQPSIQATRARLECKGLRAHLTQADAESLPFPDDSFAFVWSWGVIHHSARTARAVREISRVLAPSGEARVMVYNRNGTAARVALFRDHLMKGRFLHQTFDETLSQSADGFLARFYVRDQFEDLFRGCFRDVSSIIGGQDADILPLPQRLRSTTLRFVPNTYARRAVTRRGSFLFLTAAEPY